MTSKETKNLTDWLEDYGMSDADILHCVRFIASSDGRYLTSNTAKAPEDEGNDKK